MNRIALVTAIPLLFVNIVAFGGQFGYISDHVNWPTIGQVILALALETIALFLAYMAHQSLMAGDSAYGLRLASYAVGAIIGLLNYSHYAGPDFRPTFLAVATGFMSLASPWLWGIYSRRKNRDALKANGLIEPRAVKLGSLRWLLWMPQSWHVFRNAVWSAENDPKRAVATWGSTHGEELEGGHAIALPLSDAYEGNTHGWDSEAEWEAEMNKADESTRKELDQRPPDPWDRHREANGLPIEPPPPFQPVDEAIVGIEDRKVIDPPKEIRTPTIIKSKAQAVRSKLQNEPNAPVKDIVSDLTDAGYDITPGYVSQVKQRMKKQRAMSSE